ncbi:MAG: hypothetical protein JNM22_10980 [Saprospiraceae bacterium]|nr:hypothetical protein [Saprospiraceae bacterium]
MRYLEQLEPAATLDLETMLVVDQYDDDEVVEDENLDELEEEEYGIDEDDFEGDDDEFEEDDFEFGEEGEEDDDFGFEEGEADEEDLY